MTERVEEIRRDTAAIRGWSAHKMQGPLHVQELLEYIDAQAAKLAAAKEEVHYANGVADLAIKHRDVAEAKLAALTKVESGEVELAIVDLRAQAARECFFVQQRTTMLDAADLLTRLARERAELVVEVKEAETQVEALDAKVQSLSAHQTCGCSYDTPDDMCMHHSPKLTAAIAERDTARGEAYEACAKSCDRMAADAERRATGYENGSVAQEAMLNKMEAAQRCAMDIRDRALKLEPHE